MNRRRGSILILAVAALAGVLQSAVFAQNPTVITLYAPEPKNYEVALDEVQLEWSVSGSRPPTTPPNLVAGTAVIRRQGARTTFRVSTTDLRQLITRLQALEGANPGYTGEVVLYEPSLPHGDATRQVLTRDISVVLTDASDPDGILDRFAPSLPRAVSGVPGGFTITASDPLAAIELANTFRQQAGVASATPLMRQLQFTR